MREQLDALSKQIEKLKEVAFTNKEHLDFSDGSLTEWEIDKIREAQKLTNDITNFNLEKEYQKVKKLTKYIRFTYIGIFIMILWWIGMITHDYINVKIENKNVSTIQEEKESASKKVLSLTADLEQNIEKNNQLSTLIKQKDIQIENLKKALEESKKQPNEWNIPVKTTPNISTPTTKLPPLDRDNFHNPLLSQPEIFTSNENILSKISSQSGTTNKKIEPLENTQQPTPWKNENTSLSWSNTTESLSSKNNLCKSTTTITINVRDKAGLDGKVLWFLNEKTSLTVLEKMLLNDRTWYKVNSSKISGWISSVGIPWFDSSCLE